MKHLLKISGFLAAALCPQLCFAVSSAELYTSKAYGYGRFEARARFAAGDGVISSFFLWKDGSETTGTFWNELDFEKVGADCHVETNAIFGNPTTYHSTKHALQADLCGTYHTYAYEWTPDTITWLVDGAPIRTETGATAQAFAANASSSGMQLHFNVWPGDATFGGNFDPAGLPLHEYIDWVQYSSYDSGVFTLAWREDFSAATLPSDWLTGNWASPKNKSTHAPENVNFIDGFAVLSLTADNALGPAGAMPGDSGSGGAAGSSGVSGSGGASTPSGGASDLGGSAGTAAAGPSDSAGFPGSSGSAATGGGSLPGGAGTSSSGSTHSNSNACSFAPTTTRDGAWWALGIPMLALLRRKVRRAKQ